MGGGSRCAEDPPLREAALHSPSCPPMVAASRATRSCSSLLQRQKRYIVESQLKKVAAWCVDGDVLGARPEPNA